jgi:superfamily II DNA helicase RecQ
VAEQASQAQSEMHEAELQRIESMRIYAEQMSCRRAWLIRYFGEHYEDGCNNCDNCQGAGTERARLIAATVAETQAE